MYQNNDSVSIQYGPKEICDKQSLEETVDTFSRRDF